VEFSLNYSVEAADLLREDKIKVDRLKCADWSDMIATARELAPVYVHYPFDVGSRTGRVMDADRADAMARDTNTPFINFHIVSYDRDFPNIPRDSSEFDAIFEERLLHDIHEAINRFGKDRVIIENIPWFGASGEFHRHSVDSQIITRAVTTTGVGFLLDLSHARIAAHYLGVDPQNYIDSLPVLHLRELHVTGVRMRKTRLADHMDLLDDDWSNLEWAMNRIRTGAWRKPWTVAFEYGGTGGHFKWRSELSVIEQQAPRLYEMVKSL
jgi:uncharacterized protein